MNIETIAQIITTVGFPVVAAGALFWYVNKQGERHQEESKGMRESLAENSRVLSELKELITYLVGELKK